MQQDDRARGASVIPKQLHGCAVVGIIREIEQDFILCADGHALGLSETAAEGEGGLLDGGREAK